jgi:hypothetical protein
MWNTTPYTALSPDGAGPLQDRQLARPPASRQATTCASNLRRPRAWTCRVMNKALDVHSQRFLREHTDPVADPVRACLQTSGKLKFATGISVSRTREGRRRTRLRR